MNRAFSLFAVIALLPSLDAAPNASSARPNAACCCGAGETAVSGRPSPSPAAGGGLVYDLKSRWETDQGKPFELSELRGRAAVVALFYTTCHVACPITLQLMSDVDRSLPKASTVAIVLVTIDPKSDGVQELADCRREERLSERVFLLRGTLPATQALADATGIVFKREAARLVHVPKIVVLDPKGRVAGEFPGLQVSGAEISLAAQRAAAAVSVAATGRD